VRRGGIAKLGQLQVIQAPLHPGQRCGGGAAQRFRMALRELTACTHHRLDVLAARIQLQHEGGVGRGDIAKRLERAADAGVQRAALYILQIDRYAGAGGIDSGRGTIALGAPKRGGNDVRRR